VSGTAEDQGAPPGAASDEHLLDDADLTPMDAPVPKALSTSRRLGRYVLSHEIASGGMATVNLARAEGPGGFEKVVAIKSIHPHLAKDQAFVRMFLDEARVASRIDHPNVCRVFDFGEADGTHFIVMEYIVGETLVALHQRVFSRAEPAERARLSVYAAHIVADACEGLHAAHELRDDQGKSLGLVHRDVSPHNLFVCYDGSVRLVDFGIAKVEGRADETKSGVLKGKLAYMSPEQVRRRPIDRRADLWAMGVVLWELVTGERLFRRASEVDTLLAIERDAPPRLAEKCPSIAPELDAIVARALAREPAERYATAREMARELNRFVARSGEPVGVAEMAEWMESRFGATRDQRLRAVDEARGTVSETLTHPEGAPHRSSTSTSPSARPPERPRPPRPPVPSAPRPKAPAPAEPPKPFATAATPPSAAIPLPPPTAAMPVAPPPTAAIPTPSSEATMVRELPATTTAGRPSLGTFAAPPASDAPILPSETASVPTAGTTAPPSERLANVGVALALVVLVALGVVGTLAFTRRGPRVVLVAEPPPARSDDAGIDTADASAR
jgi:serine/threonine protein kinase